MNPDELVIMVLNSNPSDWQKPSEQNDGSKIAIYQLDTSISLHWGIDPPSWHDKDNRYYPLLNKWTENYLRKEAYVSLIRILLNKSVINEEYIIEPDGGNAAYIPMPKPMSAWITEKQYKLGKLLNGIEKRDYNQALVDGGITFG
jgi:hypothetical protein